MSAQTQFYCFKQKAAISLYQPQEMDYCPVCHFYSAFWSELNSHFHTIFNSHSESRSCCILRMVPKRNPGSQVQHYATVCLKNIFTLQKMLLCTYLVRRSVLHAESPSTLYGSVCITGDELWRGSRGSSPMRSGSRKWGRLSRSCGVVMWCRHVMWSTHLVCTKIWT